MATHLYYTDIRKYTMLSHEEERKLIADAQQDKDLHKKNKAIERLVCCHQRFVVSVAKKIGRSNNLLDLVNEGNLGLIRAIESFDLNRTNHFITYAVWYIRRNMISFIKFKQGVVCRNLQKKKDDNFDIFEDESSSKISMGADKWIFSIDEPCQNISDEHSITMEDSYEFANATFANNIALDLAEKDREKILEFFMDRLSNKEKYVIRNLFGIGCQKKTYNDIASENNCSPTHIKDVSMRAFSKMKKIANGLEKFR